MCPSPIARSARYPPPPSSAFSASLTWCPSFGNGRGLCLGEVQGLGAPIASIGGAGTFDGIFLTGLLAVLYAGPGRNAR